MSEVTDRRHLLTGADHFAALVGLLENGARAQLAAAIEASGLSASAYARTVLIRDPRTLRRWLAGDSPIPKAILRFLTH